jgi:hypothetical protein
MPHNPDSADKPVALQNAPPGHCSGALRLVCGHIEPTGHAIGAVTEAGQKNPLGHSATEVASMQKEPGGQPSLGLVEPSGHFW